MEIGFAFILIFSNFTQPLQRTTNTRIVLNILELLTKQLIRN